jgi:hypothetical protein
MLAPVRLSAVIPERQEFSGTEIGSPRGSPSEINQLSVLHTRFLATSAHVTIIASFGKMFDNETTPGLESRYQTGSLRNSDVDTIFFIPRFSLV